MTPPERPTGTLLPVDPGEPNRDYQGGNFLNAIDDVVSYFAVARNVDMDEMANLLRGYAGTMEER